MKINFAVAGIVLYFLGVGAARSQVYFGSSDEFRDTQVNACTAATQKAEQTAKMNKAQLITAAAPLKISLNSCQCEESLPGHVVKGWKCSVLWRLTHGNDKKKSTEKTPNIKRACFVDIPTNDNGTSQCSVTVPTYYAKPAGNQQFLFNFTVDQVGHACAAVGCSGIVEFLTTYTLADGTAKTDAHKIPYRIPAGQWGIDSVQPLMSQSGCGVVNIGSVNVKSTTCHTP